MSQALVATSSILVRAEALNVRRGTRHLLRDVSLVLRERELVTLVGPNGAGKSTLLKLLIGLIPAHGGACERRPGLRVGYVPQRFAVDDNLPLTVRRFLTLQLAGAGARFDETVAETAIEPLLDEPMQSLSGGESRRVLLARALLRGADLLALDEPAAGLDVQAQSEMYRLIERARDRYGCGVLVISHDLHLVMAASDEVLCLNQGRISCRGAPATVLEHPEYQAVFGHLIGPGTGIYAHGHDHRECRH